MRIILAVTTLILIASVCYSLTVGKRTGFGYGIVVGGQTAFTQTTSTAEAVTFGGEAVTFGGEGVTW